MMCILSNRLLTAADNQEFIRLPAYRSSPGIITIERVSINQVDKVAGKTFKELINEAQEDNSCWRMVAYYLLNNPEGTFSRCYAAAKTVSEHPHHGMMRACEYYQVIKDPTGKCSVTREQ